MSKTAPVQIVNKNGVSTTVHKRIDSSHAALSPAGRKIPIPSVTPVEASKKTKLLVQHSFDMSMLSADLEDDEQEKLMSTLHPETLGCLESAVEQNIPLNSLNRAMNWSIKRGDFAVLNTMVRLVPEMDEHSDLSAQDRMLYALIGIQQNREKGTPEVDITNTKDERSKGIRVLVEALTNAEVDLTGIVVDKNRHKALIFSDPKVGNLILERPDRAHEILSMYRSHGSFDRELFESALDSGVTALIDGTL